jgi:hypothetical protein
MDGLGQKGASIHQDLLDPEIWNGNPREMNNWMHASKYLENWEVFRGIMPLQKSTIHTASTSNFLMDCKNSNTPESVSALSDMTGEKIHCGRTSLISCVI